MRYHFFNHWPEIFILGVNIYTDDWTISIHIVFWSFMIEWGEPLEKIREQR